MRPFTVIGLLAPEPVCPPEDVTVYEVMELPPSEAGAVKLTDTEVLPAVAETLVGAPGTAKKVAMTLLLLSIVTVQTPDPGHAPSHDLKALPASDTGVRVTLAPEVNDVTPALPVQFRVPLLTVTVPVPEPDLVATS